MLDELYDKNGKVKENTSQDWRDLATQIQTKVIPEIDSAVQKGFKNIGAAATTLKEQMVGGKDENGKKTSGVLDKMGASTDQLKKSLDKAKKATQE